MKTRSSKKDLMKTALAAFAVIGASTLMFAGLTEAAMAAELSGSKTVATAYDVIPAAAGGADPARQPRQDYTVVPDPLTAGQEPSGLALTMEAAASQGVQLLQKLFDPKLDGATVYLSYSPGTETFPRAFWSGDVRFGERTPSNPGYGFSIDAVTGEPFDASYGRVLRTEVPLGLDEALAKNPQQYIDLAEKLVKEKGLVGGSAKSASYSCQGYSANDPEIVIEVLGSSGEMATVSFSRYDQAFKGIIFDKSIRISEAAHVTLMQDLEEQIAQARAAGGGKEEDPQLRALP